jgi:hypothetical protein
MCIFFLKHSSSEDVDLNNADQDDNRHSADIGITTENEISEGSNFPPELTELEEVDMTDENMDPIEWAVRKLIPIPKTYFWQIDSVDPKELPGNLKLWHRTVGAMGSAVKFTDRIGKQVADALGLSASRFDYVTSTMNEEDWNYSRRAVQERLRNSEAGLEGGELGSNTESMPQGEGDTTADT